MRRCGTWAKRARVPLRCVRAGEGAGRLFSTPSRPALAVGLPVLALLHRVLQALLAGQDPELQEPHALGLGPVAFRMQGPGAGEPHHLGRARLQDRKSTRLNSSHTVISYAVFCLKKKKK